MPPNDIVCFHCQQSAEKYLKGLMEELDFDIPKTHDLERLTKLLRPHHSSLRFSKRAMEFLSGFAVETRYPGEDATRRQAQSALRWMERIRKESRRLLGL
jgi:HEPN domain-containing protein